MSPQFKLGFLASLNGYGMRAIVKAIEAGELDAEARILITHRRGAPALAFAADHALPSRVIPTFPAPEAADAALADALRDARVEIVILSGYLRKLGPRSL